MDGNIFYTHTLLETLIKFDTTPCFEEVYPRGHRDRKKRLDSGVCGMKINNYKKEKRGGGGANTFFIRIQSTHHVQAY